MFRYKKKPPKLQPPTSEQAPQQPVTRISVHVAQHEGRSHVLFAPTLDVSGTHVWAKDALICLIARSLLQARREEPALSVMFAQVLMAIVKEDGAKRFRHRPTVYEGVVGTKNFSGGEELKIEIVSLPLQPPTVQLSGNLHPLEAILPFIQQLVISLKSDELESLAESIEAPLKAFAETTSANEHTIEQRALHQKFLMLAEANPELARRFGIKP